MKYWKYYKILILGCKQRLEIINTSLLLVYQSSPYLNRHIILFIEKYRVFRN
jgi:hypothetical protein